MGKTQRTEHQLPGTREVHAVSRSSNILLARIRRFFRSGLTGRPSRSRLWLQRNQISAPGELLEARQLLVMPPGFPVINVSQSPVTIEWVHPTQDNDPAVSFDIVVNRTDLLSGGSHTAITETARTATVPAGETERYTVTEPLAPGTYSVLITARGAGNVLSPTVSTSFVIEQKAPEILTISGRRVSPGTTTPPVVGGDVRLSWTAMPGINDYYVKIDRRSATGWAQIPDVIPRAVKGNILEHDLPSGEYRVRVRPLSSPAAWSQIAQFAVTTSQVDAPEITSSAAAVSQGGALTWTLDRNAVGYHVEIQQAGSTILTTDTVHSPEYKGVFLSNGSYTARVRSLNAVGTASEWSTPVTFSVSNSTYKPVINASPVGIQVNGVQDLEWSPITWASSYEVTITRIDGTTAIVRSRERLTESRFSFPRLPAGTYTATVKAFDRQNTSGPNQVSISESIVVTTTTYQPASPFLIQTHGGQQLMWNRIASAVRYDVVVELVKPDLSAVLSTIVRQGSQDEVFSLDHRFLEGNTYRARIRPVWANAEVGTFSQNLTFSLSASPQISIRLTPNTDPQRPRIEWTDLPAATSYRLQLYNSSSPAIPVLDQQRLAVPYFQPDKLLPPGTYVAIVDAILQGQATTRSSGHFVIPPSPPISATTDIRVLQEDQQTTIRWTNPASGFYDVRLVRIDQPDRDVVREQTYSASNTSAEKTHRLRSGYGPGLYRADVGHRVDPAGPFQWKLGTVFYFNGIGIDTLRATGSRSAVALASLTGPFRGDFDGDSRIDLLTRNNANGQIQVFVNESTDLNTAAWADFSTQSTDFVKNGLVASILVGDFNGDGRDDLLQPDMDSGTWAVMRSSTQNTFEKVIAPVHGVVNPDLPTFSWNAQTRVLSWKPISSVFNSSRNYELQIVKSGSGNSPSSIFQTVSRTANDNSSQLLSASLTSLPAGEYTVFVRTMIDDRTSQWSEGFPVSVPDPDSLAGTSNWSGYFVGDFNGDNRDDIAAYNSVRQQWVVALANGTFFERSVWHSSFAGNSSMSLQAIADVNADGRKDLVYRSGNSDTWTIGLSTGTSFLMQSWNVPAFLNSVSSATALQVADVNADGGEDLIAAVNGGYQVALADNGEFAASIAGTAWQAALMPSNSVAVDVNGDQRADLVGFDSSERSIVALATTSGFTTPSVWQVDALRPWFTRLQESGVSVVDYSYRTRETQSAFQTIQNTIDFEGYRGLKKGADGTQASKSGNAWDQANLLGTMIREKPWTAVRYVTGRMKLTPAQVNSWLTTTVAPSNYFELAGLNPAVDINGNIEFDHAWLQALLPASTGLTWVNLNPSFKASQAAVPNMISPPFLADDLKAYLSPIARSFFTDFDSGGSSTDHDAATTPAEFLFNTGSGQVVTENTWPKHTTATGQVDDFKLKTSHASPTSFFVGEPAVNGKISASIIVQEFVNTTLQDFRVFARATDDYEIGFIWPQGDPNAGYTQKLYERIGDSVVYLNATIDTTASGAPEFKLMVPVPEAPARTAAGVMQCQVDLSIENNTLTVFVQWKRGSVISKLKLTSTVPLRAGSGRFGIYTGGSGHHYLDNIRVEARDIPKSSPLTWAIEQALIYSGSANAVRVDGIGSTRNITVAKSDPAKVALTPIGPPKTEWGASDYQTITLSFLRPDGSTAENETLSGIAPALPQQLSEVARRNIVVRTSPDGRSASLLVDGMTYVRTVPFSGDGSLRLRVELRTSPSATAETQILPLQAESYSQVLLRAGQYSATDVAQAGSALSEAYNGVPLTAINSGGTINTNAYNPQQILERVLSYSVIRLLKSSEQSENDIARITQSVLLRPGVTAGLITGKSNTVQPDSVYFIRPKNITVDFPVGKFFYVPRAPEVATLSSELQQSRALLTLTELSAREQDLLSEISDKSALSALEVLSLASVNGAVVRRLKKNADGTYSDVWNTSVPASGPLSSFLNFGTSSHQVSAFNRIQQQLNAGGIVTVASTMQSMNGWTGFAWLHERYPTNGTSSPPIIDSLMLSNTDGLLLHGGVVSNGGAEDSTDFSQFRDTGVTPELHQGLLRRTDTDFSVSIPGMTVPFSRTWTSSRSNASTTTNIMDGTDISGFGAGWTHPFSQQLDISTITPTTVYHVKKGNFFTGHYYVAVQNNTDRVGEPVSIVWRREDGSSGVFSPNGKSGTTLVNAVQVTTAEYDSPFNMPGLFVRRIDGSSPGVYGDSYEVIHADGSVYRFQDFNTAAVRQTGKTTAYLVAIINRFGNSIAINRDAADRSRITSITSPTTQQVLASFTYTNSRVTRIVVPGALTGNASSEGITGARIWDYRYDNSNRLSSVQVSEASGTALAWNPTSTITRFSYSWYQNSGTQARRGDRLDGFLKSATGFSGTVEDTGDSSRTLYEYYGNGRLRSVRDAEDRETTFLYNAQEDQASTVDASGILSTTQFSDLGDMEMSVLPSGERIFFEMAPNARQVSRTMSTNSRSESWKYDDKGNVIEHRDAAGITQLMTYHPVYNQVVTISERSTAGVVRRITTNEYFNTTSEMDKSLRGALSRSRDALNNATQYRYTPQGLIAEVNSPKGHKTLFDADGYDAFGNPLRVDYQELLDGVFTTKDSSESVFDNAGHLKEVREYDSSGQGNRVTSYSRDALGRLIESSTPDPYDSNKVLRTQYFYNSLGLLDRRIDPDGAVWRKEYDNTGRLLREIRPDGTFSEIQYNINGTVAASIDPNGNETRFVYDALNRLVQTIFPDGTSTTRVYDARGDLEQEIDPRGFITRHEYDSAGRLLRTFDAENQETTYGYDTFGNQISVSTETGVITNLFNANRQIVQTLYESRQSVNGISGLQKVRVDRFFYDANGNQLRSDSIDLRPDTALMPSSLIQSLTDNLVTVTEAAGVDQSRKRITTTAFDFRDRPVSSTNAAGGVSSKIYSYGQEVISSRDARGAQTSYFYDLAGQLQFEAMPTANTTETTGLARVYRRDSMGRVVETRETPYQKNSANNLVQRNSNGEPTSAGDSVSARITRTVYDVLGRVIAAQDAMGFMTRITYDPAGNVIETIDASRRSRFKILNKMNRVVREVLPPVLVVTSSSALDASPELKTPTLSTSYDESGNVVSVTDASGQTTTFLYDGLNRQVQKSAPTIMGDFNGIQSAVTPVWKWTYDALGNVTTEVDPAMRTTTYTYDLFGRVLSKTRPDPDGSGPLTAAVTEFTYDAFGNLLTQLEKGSLSFAGDERLTIHEYNALNLKTRTTFPDPDGDSGPAASPMQSWQYDANGNLIAETNSLGRITNFTWNLLNRLTKTELPAVSGLPASSARSATSTTYDLFGNITSTTDALGRTTRFDHDESGRVTLTIMPHPDGVAWSGLRSFSTATDYDAHGNVIRVTDHMARVSTSAYDSLNRLIRSTKPDPYSNDTETAPLETISYDINGNVARKTDALGRVTRFEYDALNRSILTAVQDGSIWAETETRYDLAGNPTRIIDPLERVTVYTFNNWNLQTRVRLPSTTADTNAGPATSTTYDQWGNVLTVTGPRSGVTQNEYDRLNRLTRQLLPIPAANITRPETTFEYDAAGNVVLQSVLMSRVGTSEVWTETETTYDELNRVIRTAVRASQVPASSSPSEETITSTAYDRVGNVLSVTRHGETAAENRTTSFQYDRLNRKVAEIAPAPSSTSGSPVTRYRYDLAGNLEATIDPLGRITSNTYDALGRLWTTISPDPDGLQGPLSAPASIFRYDVVGNLLSTTDHLGRTTTSTYDSRNRVVSVTQPDADLFDHFSAPMTRYTYDLVGNKTQETDALGNTTDYVYDNLNRLTTTILPDALVNDRLARPTTTFTYDLAGNLTSTTDAAGRITLAYYDILNRKTQDRTADPDGAGIANPSLITLYSYDAAGNLLTSNSFRSATVGRITRNEYDYLNRLIRTTAPAPKSTDAQLVTLYDYDVFGNQTSVTQTSTAVNTLEKTTVYVYDNLNRLTETRSPNPLTGALADGPVSSTTYDLAGRVLTQTDATDRVTTFLYDELDRKVRVVGQDPDASSNATADKVPAETLYAYDDAGNLLSTRIRRNVNAVSSTASSADVFTTTSNLYDRLDRLTTVIDANGDATQYRYDNNGQRIQLTDATWNTSRWQYDGLGQVVAETDANGFSTVFEYDLVGNVTAVTDRRGFRTNYVRDNLDRITHEQWLRTDTAGTVLITELRNRYDSYGRHAVAEQWNMASSSPTLVSISNRTYDDLDRLLINNNSSTPGQNFARFTYEYNAFGNLTSRDQQTGTSTSRIIVTTGYSGYDYLNRLTQLNQTASGPFANWQNKSVRLSYYDDGSTQSITRYSDATWTNIVVNTAFGLDASGRLISQIHTRPNGIGTTTISSYQYKYLADGKLMNEVSAVPSLNFNGIVNNFGYDATGQLTSADRGQGADESFAYDSTGNRIVNNSIVGKGNRIQNDGNFIYTYDAEGNITRRQRVITAQGADTLQEYTTYSWDHRNHLTKVEFFTAAGILLKRVEHTYDSDDNRISKKVTTFGTTPTITTENYVCDGAQLVATLNASGAIQHQYFDGTSLDQIFADQNSVSGILWPLEDRTGTARDIINTAGAVLDHRVLDSFGTVNSQSGPNVNYEQFFSGLLWDADSQLYYARARWYEPVSGRFLSEDPLGFEAGDNNISRYSGNDPINYVDRNGLFSIGHAWNKLTDAVGDAFEDVGDFFEDQWDNGNIQKGLLAAGTLASGGMLGFGLASGSLMGTQILAGGLGFASGLGSSYEVFSGNRIGDGSFTRYLGAAAAVSGGFFAAGVRSIGTLGRTLSGASGLISGYEIASGDIIGDGTLSSLFHVSNLGVNQGGTMFSPTSTNAQRFGVGLNLAVGTASVISSGDRSLQQSLRALSIASGVWNTGTATIAAASNFRQTIQTVKAAQQPRRAAAMRQSRPVEDEPSESNGGLFSVAPEDSVHVAQPLEAGDRLLPSVYQLTGPHEVFAYEDTNPLIDFARAEQHLQQKAYRNVKETAASIDKWLAERRRLHVLYVNDDAYQQELTAASMYHDGYVAQFRDLTGQDYHGSLKNWTPPHVPTFGSELGERFFGEESRTNPQSFAYGYRHYLTNPDQMDMDLRVGFYASTTIAATSGTLATGGILFGGGSIGAISTYGGGLVFAGGTAGGIDGGFNAYASGVISDGGLAFGVGSGVIGGVLNPISGFTSLGGGVIGGGIDYMSGGDFLGRGYQVGSFGGGIVGMGADDLYKGATFLHAGGQTLVNGTIMGGTAYGAYQYTGNMDTALFAGNLAAVPSSIFARWAVTCFPAGTPVLTPNGSIPIEQLKIGDSVISRDENDVSSEVAAKKIDKVFVRDGELWELRINGLSVQVTADHPIFLKEKGWVPVDKIVRGDRIAALRHSVRNITTILDSAAEQIPKQRNDWDTDWLPVESCEPTGIVTTVYNFRVEDWHTYFIALNNENAFWVHNADYPIPIDVEVGHSYPREFIDSYTSRKAFRTEVAEATYSAHNFKHLKARTDLEAKLFSGNGEAQFLPSINDRGLEKLALQKGVVVKHGGGYHAFIQFDQQVGFDNGLPATWLRAELSGGVFHGHPMHESRLPSFLR